MARVGGMPALSEDQPRIPEEEYSDRQRRAAERCRELDLDALLAWSRGGGSYDNFGDVYYLTNHYSPFPWIYDRPPLWAGRGQAAVVVTSEGEVDLCVDIPDWRVDLVRADRVRSDPNLYRGITSTISERGLARSRIGMVGLQAMSATAYSYLLHELNDVDWVPADDLVMSLRMLKSDAEVEMLRFAARAGIEVIRAVLDAAVEGATDADCAAAGLATSTRIPGCAQWDISLASGPDSHHFQWARMPQWDATRPYRRGDFVHPDNYGYVNGYLFDIGRTRVVGDQPAGWQREIISGSAACVRHIASLMTPGITCGELHDAGRAFLRDNDLTEQTVFDSSFPSFGHQDGLGFDNPWIVRGAPDQDAILAPKMVFSVEVECARNGHAAAFEDMVLVREDGPAEILTMELPAMWGT